MAARSRWYAMVISIKMPCARRFRPSVWRFGAGWKGHCGGNRPVSAQAILQKEWATIEQCSHSPYGAEETKCGSS